MLELGDPGHATFRFPAIICSKLDEITFLIHLPNSVILGMILIEMNEINGIQQVPESMLNTRIISIGCKIIQVLFPKMYGYVVRDVDIGNVIGSTTGWGGGVCDDRHRLLSLNTHTLMPCLDKSIVAQ